MNDAIAIYRTYYLNNTGNRYVLRNKNNRNIKIQINNIIRRVKYFEQHGYDCKAYYSYKGKLTYVWIDFTTVLLWDEL